MPSFRHHDHGNLYIQFEVKFPPSHFNTPEKIAALESILPPRYPSSPPPEAMDIEEALLEEIDPTQQARAVGNSMDEDDDDHHHGGERVATCASQ